MIFSNNGEISYSELFNSNEKKMAKGKYFKDYKIVIFENNSDDNTREKISSYSNIDLIGNNDGEDFSSGYEESRIQRLANYRSQVQSYIKNNYSDYDHVIIIDFDIKLFSIDGILTSLAWDKNFDVMGSVSLVYQPDLVSEDGEIEFPIDFNNIIEEGE